MKFTESKFRIATVIVTYNQIEDLKNCISAVRYQTNKVDEIIVVNNSSTDGTQEWLKSQNDLTVLTQENSGSSGGQYTGIKYAFENKFDWIWCLDQDVFPQKNALEEMLLSKPMNETNTGFISSLVFDPKGELAFINLPYVKNHKKMIDSINRKEVFPVFSSSFGSVLFSRKAVEKVGYPIKNFFIWGDDVEYTMRIIENGYNGFLVSKSAAVHNVSPNLQDPFPYMEVEHFKTKYAIRNTLYTIRLRNKVLYKSYFKGIGGCFLFILRLLKNRYRLKGFPGIKYHLFIIKFFFAGLFFSPRKYLQSK